MRSNATCRMSGLRYKINSKSYKKFRKTPNWIAVIFDEGGSVPGPSVSYPDVLSKNIVVPINTEISYDKETPKERMLRIMMIQDFLNVPITGKWNSKTDKAYRKLLEEYNLSPKELSERIKAAQTVNLETGEARKPKDYTRQLNYLLNEERKREESPKPKVKLEGDVHFSYGPKPADSKSDNYRDLITYPYSPSSSTPHTNQQVDDSSTFSAVLGALDRFLGKFFLSEEEQKEGKIKTQPSTSPSKPSTQSPASSSKPPEDKRNEEDDTIPETYQLLGLTRDFRSSDISYGHSFVHTFDNDTGGSYIIGRKIAEMKDKDGTVRDTTYQKSAGVAHFLMDADISPNQKKANVSYRTLSGDLVQSQYPDIFLPYVPQSEEEYIMQFKPKNDGEYLVRYKKLKDTGLTLDDLRKGNYISKDGWDTRYPIRSFDPENIDWDNNTGTSFTLRTPTLVTKDGKPTPIPSKKSDLYSRYSGASVVFIIEKPNGKSVAKDVAGSVDTIREQYDQIKKEYPGSKVTMLVHDAGSYSFKPVDYDGLSQSSYVDFNTYNRGFSGAGLHIPKRLVPPETLKLIEETYRKHQKQKHGGLIFKRGGMIQKRSRDMSCGYRRRIARK